MFDTPTIVQSAISAFNNAALVGPAFLWWAILSVPLYVIVYRYGRMLADGMGWTRDNILVRVAFWCVVLTFGWIVLFGGNYGVLRDDVSLLPMLNAAIVFVASMFVGSHMRDMNFKKMHELSWRGRVLAWGAGGIALGGVALSDMHAWWGPIMQIAACMGGFIIGYVARGSMRTIAGTILIIMTTTVAIMMQPEFFRWGQLGNLTLAHLGIVLMIGVSAAATCALANVPARGKIHRSAYIKLKYMFRVMAALGVALTLLTESVPLFLGTVAVFLGMFAMSIWHAQSIPENLVNRMFAGMLGLFGVMVSVPVISALGIMLYVMMPGVSLWRDMRFLL